MDEIQFRKTALIKAFQMTLERRWDNKDWPEWMNRAWNAPSGHKGSIWIDPNDTTSARLIVGTLENPMAVSWNDWIARGVEGELWPIKPEIFAKTYERADVSQDAALASLRVRAERMEKVVEAARVVGDCFDHEGNCCSEWCERCQTSKAFWKKLEAALAALDALEAG